LLVNPPADPATDTDAEEHRTIAAILDALDGSGLEKVVALSTYGARPGTRIGDLGTLHALEEGVAGSPIPADVLRAAYFMGNWDAMLEPARAHGVLPSMLPADLTIPMVDHQDVGRAAARLLMAPPGTTGVHHVEGPEHASPEDVAAAFADALDRPVEVRPVPPEAWEDTFRNLGFSDAAAASYAGMTDVAVHDIRPPADPIRGEVSLREHVARLVGR
jgi:uncharacterized protein YbjT (DUF2867 family)